MADIGSTAGPVRRTIGPLESRRASRTHWDRDADAYQAEHGRFLGDARFIWSPEGLDEAEIGLLGDVSGRRVLEIGCGAAQCGRWLVAQGADVVALDLSAGQLRWSQVLDRRTGITVPTVLADAEELPFTDASFDLVCSAFGAVPFVAAPERVMAEVARVLRPGGSWTFSVPHPLRWAFPDDPSERGLTVQGSYFDRLAYVEQDDEGVAAYVEHHRTLGDRVRDIAAAGLVLEDLVEPEWPESLTEVWGGWSPERGAKIPGTAIFVTRKPA